MSSCLDRWRWLRRGNAAEIEFKSNSKKGRNGEIRKRKGGKEPRMSEKNDIMRARVACEE